MKKKMILGFILMIIAVTVGVLLFIINGKPKYSDYVVIDDNAQYAENKLINNNDIVYTAIQTYSDELLNVGVNNIDDYEVSYSSNKTLVTVIFTLEEKTVYLELKFDDELSSIISYSIFDDQEAE